jgi:thiamine biosynthesis lipoprotein
VEAGSPERASGQLLRLEESLDAMGSTYTVALYGYNEDQMEAAVEAAFSEVRRLDRMLSNYRPDAELAGINRQAADRPVKVTPELFDLLLKCKEYSRESEGAFDITVGPLMRVWGFFKGTGRLPAKEDVAKALRKVGYRNVILDRETRTVRFAQPGVELDPGGIGKGYAVDRMVDVLKDNGIASALVSAGGSSIYALGTPNNSDKGWEVKIRDPKDARKTIEDVYLKNQSMSTSGSYEKFFEAEGRIYSHIMDPRTGYPARGVLSVSVITPTTLDSEGWTKPYFILGRQWAAKHKPGDFRVFICEDKAEQPCAWLQ